LTKTVTVQCTEPPNHCTIPVYSINGVLCAHCECYDDIGLIEIDPSQLNQKDLGSVEIIN
jgi:hypothetical protein